MFKDKRLSVIWTFIPLASLKFLISSLLVDFQEKGIYNQKVNTELLYWCVKGILPGLLIVHTFTVIYCFC